MFSYSSCSLLAIVTAQASNYHVERQQVNFSQAQAFCESEYGSDLASIHSEADNIEATELCRDSNYDCWIGLNDINFENQFVWLDGTSFEYGSDTNGGMGPWAANNPNNVGNEDCVFLNGQTLNYLWADMKCSHKCHFICNVPPTAAPVPTQEPPLLSTQSPSNPTNNPTIDPSASPSNPPLAQLNINPPLITTEYQSSTTAATLEIETAHDADKDDNDNSPSFNYALLFGCIATVSLCAALLCCTLWCVYRRNAVADTEKNKNIKIEVISGAQNHNAHNKRSQAAHKVHDNVVVGDEEQGDDVHALKSRFGKMAMTQQNIQRFCDDAQNDEEVVGDDEIENGGTTKGMQNASSKSIPYQHNDENVVQMQRVERHELEGKQSESSKTRSSDSSVVMHDDHWAVLKVTNFNGVDHSQKLEIFDIDQSGQQNVQHVVNGTDTKGKNENFQRE